MRPIALLPPWTKFMASQNSMARGFDFVAPFYDLIVYLVFGKTFINLQSEVFAELQSQNNCLIIGGGSGQVLELAIEAKLSKHFYYADLSPKMLRKAKSRIETHPEVPVDFSLEWKAWKSNEFDYIVLPFVLDCYPASQVSAMIQELKECLSPKGKIVLFDFNEEVEHDYAPAIWKHVLISWLYMFFRKTAGVQATTLAPFNLLFGKQGFKPELRNTRMNGWIQGVVFSLQEQPTNTVN